MAINFPNSPSVNVTHTANGITWKWDGTTWKVGISTINAATIPGISTTGTSYFYNVSVASSVTADTFYGDGSGLVGIAATNSQYANVAGIATNAQSLTGTPDIIVNNITSSDITPRNINSSGIVTATAFVGDGSALTGISGGGGGGQGGTTGSGSFSGTPSFLSNIDNVVTTKLALEYILYFSHSTGKQVQKVLILNNGSSSYLQEFAVVNDNDPLVSVGSSIFANTLYLNVTPEANISGTITWKFLRNDIT